MKVLNSCVTTLLLLGLAPWAKAGLTELPAREFQTMPQVDLQAGNLRPGFPLDQPNSGLCETACKEDAACRGYTYVPPGLQDSRRAMCWLKASIGVALVSQYELVSGVRNIVGPEFNIGLAADLPGSDFKSVSNLSYPDCVKACQGDLNCLAFTFVAPGYQKPQSMCYLKGLAPNPVLQRNGMISGERTYLKNPLAIIEPGQDRPGSDYSRIAVARVLDCAIACNDDYQCRAFTYVGAPVQGPSNWCYLKNDKPEPRPAGVKEIVSGLSPRPYEE